MSGRTSSAEIAWAAGLFEGEGSFTAHRVRADYWNVGASIQMTDRDVIEKFAAIVGMGYVEPLPRHEDHHKDLWRWRVHDTAGVQSFIKIVLPWLCERRRQRALDVDAVARTIRPGYVAWNDKRTHCRSGHPLEGDNVLSCGRRNGAKTRRCKECRRKYQRDRYHAKRAERKAGT